MKKLVERLSMKAVRRLVVGVIGGTVILFGILLSLPFVPGPGFVAILAGLAILATEFVWARSLLNKVRERVRSAVNRVNGKNSPQSAGTDAPSPESRSSLLEPAVPADGNVTGVTETGGTAPRDQRG